MSDRDTPDIRDETLRSSSMPCPNTAEIRFTQPDEAPYGALSNYYMCPLLIDGSRYPSVEHAYQAFKALRPEVRKWIAQAPTAHLAAVAGDGLLPEEISPGWTAQRVSLMSAVLQTKFTQHRDLADLLLSTGDATLAEWALEDNPVNRFWSKVNGEGANTLGQLLMELRVQLRAAACGSSSETGRTEGE